MCEDSFRLVKGREAYRDVNEVVGYYLGTKLGFDVTSRDSKLSKIWARYKYLENFSLTVVDSCAYILSIQSIMHSVFGVRILARCRRLQCSTLASRCRDCMRDN